MITLKFCIPYYYVKWINKRFCFFKYLEDYWGEYDGYDYTKEIESDTFVDDVNYIFLGKYNNEDYEQDELNGCYCVPLFVGRLINWFNTKLNK